MKKGLLIIFSLMLSVFISGTAYALVCGQPPNSQNGFGEIKLGISFFPCNNNYDGICPEDYEDFWNPALFGNCSNCPDPDCTGNIGGIVKDTSVNPARPLPNAIVTTHPVRWNMSASSMENTTTTSVSEPDTGKYSMRTVSGIYYVSASKAGYDTELKLVTITKGVINTVDFNLQNGTCHADCTNSYGRCNALCQGLVFDDDECKFDSPETMTLCHNRMKGTTVYYGPSHKTNYAEFIDCCEGVPTERYYAAATIESSAIKNLAKLEKIVRYDDVPVKIVVAYWSR